MTQPDNEQMGEALNDLTRAYKRAARVVEQTADPQHAFERATLLVGWFRGMLHGDAAELRARTVARIWDTEKLSLAGLADRIGVSKARADQLMRAHKRASTREDGHDAASRD